MNRIYNQIGGSGACPNMNKISVDVKSLKPVRKVKLKQNSKLQ